MLDLVVTCSVCGFQSWKEEMCLFMYLHVPCIVSTHGGGDESLWFLSINVKILVVGMPVPMLTQRRIGHQFFNPWHDILHPNKIFQLRLSAIFEGVRYCELFLDKLGLGQPELEQTDLPLHPHEYQHSCLHIYTTAWQS